MTLEVLLAEQDAPLGRAVLHSLAKVCIRGEWVRSAADLRAWTARARTRVPNLVLLDWELPGAAPGEALGVVEGYLPSSTIVVLGERLTGDTAAVLLSRGIPSIHKPVNPFVLSMLALDLSSEEQAFFCDLVAFNQASTAAERQHRYEALVLMQR